MKIKSKHHDEVLLPNPTKKQNSTCTKQSVQLNLKIQGSTNVWRASMFATGMGEHGMFATGMGEHGPAVKRKSNERWSLERITFEKWLFFFRSHNLRQIM